MRTDTIVGYAYKADTYCPVHIVPLVAADHDIVLDGSERDIEPRYPGEPDVERELWVLAVLVDIDYAREESYDTDDFPKIIFADVAEEDRCAICHVLLVE